VSAFLAKHQYVVIFIVGLIIIGAAAILIVQLNGVYLSNGNGNSSAAPAIPAAPAAPSVSLVIQKSGKTNTLVVNWANLPDGTTELNIFRAKNSSSTPQWALWKTVQVGNADTGSAEFNLTNSDLGYQYYVQATGKNPTGDGGGPATNVLWTSSSTTPMTTTSTVPTTGNNNGNGGGQNNNTSSTNTTTTTSNNGNNGTSGNSTTTGTGGNGNAPTGNAYYNPQVQITGYGTTLGSFWVEHVNQSIEVGWQNLPTSTDELIFYRSTTQDGPWNQFLKQKNPGSTGSYSLQIVDGTLGDPYYYQMVAYANGVTVGTYGPIYLPAAN